MLSGSVGCAGSGCSCVITLEKGAIPKKRKGRFVVRVLFAANLKLHCCGVRLQSRDWTAILAWWHKTGQMCNVAVLFPNEKRVKH